MLTYLHNIFLASSRLINAILGGQAEESLSSHMWRKQDFRYKIINLFFFWQNNHCRGSYNWERERYKEFLKDQQSIPQEK